MGAAGAVLVSVNDSGYAAIKQSIKSLTAKQRLDIIRRCGAEQTSPSTPGKQPKTPKKNINNDMSKIKCYNCNELGHKSDDCPHPPTPETLAARAKKKQQQASQ